MTIKAVNAETLEVVSTAKKAVKGRELTYAKDKGYYFKGFYRKGYR